MTNKNIIKYQIKYHHLIQSMITYIISVCAHVLHDIILFYLLVFIFKNYRKNVNNYITNKTMIIIFHIFG